MKKLNYAALMAALIVSHANVVCGKTTGKDKALHAVFSHHDQVARALEYLTSYAKNPETERWINSLSDQDLIQFAQNFAAKQGKDPTIKDFKDSPYSPCDKKPKPTLLKTEEDAAPEPKALAAPSIAEDSPELIAQKATWNVVAESLYDATRTKALQTKISALSAHDALEVQVELETLVKLRGNAHPNIQGQLLESMFKLRDAKVTVNGILEAFPYVATRGTISLESNLKLLSNIIKAVGIPMAKGYIERFSSGAKPHEKRDIALYLSSVFERTGENARLILDTIINPSWTTDQQRQILSLIANEFGLSHYLSDIMALNGKPYDEVFKTLDRNRMAAAEADVGWPPS